jgi:hypothetical protein
MAYEVTATRSITHKVDGTSVTEWLRGPFDDLQTAMLAVVRLRDEINRQDEWPPKFGPDIVHFKREITITNLATGRRVQPSQRQVRWANQHCWPSSRVSWIWPSAEETEI